MAVVAAGELHDEVPAGRSTGEPERAHRGLRAGRREAELRHRRDGVPDRLAEVDLARRGCPQREAVERRRPDRLDDGGVGVPEDGRAPRADAVDVPAPVGVTNAGPGACREHERRPAHRAERPDGAVHPAGEQVDGAADELGLDGTAGRERRPSSGVPVPEPGRQVRGRIRDHEVGARPDDRGDRLEMRPLRGRSSRAGQRPRSGRTRRSPGRQRSEARSGPVPAARMSSDGMAGLTSSASAPSSTSIAISRMRLAAVRRVHLVAPPVAERRRGIGGLAERAVVGRRGLRRVGEDRRVRGAVGVEGGADRGHLAVHHRARGDDVGAGPGLRDGGRAEASDRGVVVDPAVARRAGRSGRGRCTRTGRCRR